MTDEVTIMVLADKRYVKCKACRGTGVDHYDDYNPCPICNGDSVVEENKEEISE